LVGATDLTLQKGEDAMPGKKKATKGKRRGNPAKAVAVPGALVLSIESDKMQKLVDKCIRETGTVTFGVREITVTKLGELTEANVIVN
jgi:hypothetical protein